MLAEGVPAAMIENVGRMAGMPVGPLALNDEVAVDLAWKILKATEADLGASAIDPAQKELLSETRREARPLRPQERQGLLRLSGAAARSGYGRASPTCSRPSSIPTRSTSPNSRTGCSASRRSRPRAASRRGVLTDVREADVGSILGFGFAPFSGGTLSYIDMMGTARFVARCEELSMKCGPRFAPSPLLLDMAAEGRDLLRPLRPARPRSGGVVRSAFQSHKMVMAQLVPATPIIMAQRCPTIGVAGTSPAMTPRFGARLSERSAATACLRAWRRDRRRRRPCRRRW